MSESAPYAPILVKLRLNPRRVASRPICTSAVAQRNRDLDLRINIVRRRKGLQTTSLKPT